MGAVKNLIQVRDGNSHVFAGSTPAGGWNDIRVLAASTHEAHAVPAGAKYVRVTVTGNTFINIGGVATVAAADITDGTASILMVNALPRLFDLNGAITIGVIASAIQTVVLEFYS
jgi:hypothetical protein